MNEEFVVRDTMKTQKDFSTLISFMGKRNFFTELSESDLKVDLDDNKS